MHGNKLDAIYIVNTLGKMWTEEIEEHRKDELIMSATNKRSPSKLFDNLMARYNKDK